MNGKSTGFLHEAATLVAGQRGAAQRLLSQHRPRSNGSCRGCGDSPRTRWPCVLVAIAELSVTIHGRRQDVMSDPKKEPPKPGRHEDDRDGKGTPQPDRWKDPNK